MRREDGFIAGKIGDRACNLQDALISAHAELQRGNGSAEQLFRFLIRYAEAFCLPVVQLRVAMFADGAIPFLLDASILDKALAD